MITIDIAAIEAYSSSFLMANDFFSVLINGDNNRIATRKKERNRSPVRMYNCFFDSSSLSLFLKYITAVAATAAIKTASRYKNQYFEPNEINLCFFQ